MRTVTPPSERFWAKVAKSDGCWEWTAGTWQAFGYGKFQAGSGRADNRAVYAHRYAWEMVNGPVPAGLFVCHRCDNPRCVRVDHLFLGTPLDNIRDMYVKGRQARPDIERAIPRGEQHGNHVLTDEVVREIRRASASGVGPLALAARRTWRHVA